MTILTIGIGSAPNDGTGDSIRDAFDKANKNFAFLDQARQNLETGNLVISGNLTINSSVPSNLIGTYYLNGKEIATVGTAFGGGTVSGKTFFTYPDNSTSTTTGAVILSGGLAVQKNTYLTDAFAQSLTVTNGISAASINAPSATLNGPVATGALTVSGTVNTTGDITAGAAGASNVTGYSIVGQNLYGTIRTAAQTSITQVGTLASLAVTGNITAGNLAVSGVASITGNVTTGNLTTGIISTTGGAVIGGNVTVANIAAGVGSFGNITVQNVPSNYHVTNKGYVNSVVAAFAVALGG